MPGDYGGANDGRCEFSFFVRCPDIAQEYVTFGQFAGWTYNYCQFHARMIRNTERLTLLDRTRPTGDVVCITHGRHVPCRWPGEHALSSDQADVDAVDRYQRGGHSDWDREKFT